MENQKILDSKSVKGFIKGSLVVTGLFAILYCGVAALVLFFCGKCTNNACENNVLPLITIFAIPLIVFLTVFLIFSCLVKSYYEKLYGSSGNEGTLIKMRDIEVVSQVINVLERAIIHDSEKYNETLQNKLEIIIEMLSKISSGDKVNSSGAEK